MACFYYQTSWSLKLKRLFLLLNWRQLQDIIQLVVIIPAVVAVITAAVTAAVAHVQLLLHIYSL